MFAEPFEFELLTERQDKAESFAYKRTCNKTDFCTRKM